MFQFLIGVSLVLYLGKRTRQGSTAAARLQAMRRFALLLALGVLLDSVGALRVEPRWGVLQTLAEGGLLATLLASASDPVLAALAIGLLALFSGSWNGEVHRGPIAALAFVPLTLVGGLLGEEIAAGSAVDAIAVAATRVAVLAAAVGLALGAAGIPFNKVLGTSSFVAVATAVATALLAAAARWEARGGRFPAWLLLVGRNALTAWVLLHVLVYYPAWIAFPAWDRLGLAPGLVSVAVTTVALCAVTVSLGRRGIRVPV